MHDTLQICVCIHFIFVISSRAVKVLHELIFPIKALLSHKKSVITPILMLSSFSFFEDRLCFHLELFKKQLQEVLDEVFIRSTSVTTRLSSGLLV